MKFLADENIPLEAIDYLQKHGIDILSLSLTNPGKKDENVLNLAISERRTLITLDKDFGKLIFKLKKQSFGIIFLRIHPQSVESIITILKKILSLNIAFEKSFCVVDPHRIRILPL